MLVEQDTIIKTELAAYCHHGFVFPLCSAAPLL